MKKSTVFFLSALSMLIGVIIGLACASTNKGNRRGSNYFDSKDEEDQEDLYGC